MEYTWSKGTLIASGVLAALLGIVLISLPGLTLATIVWLFAGYLILYGIVRIIGAILEPEGSKNRLPWVIFGALAILAGFGLFAYPGITLVILAYYIGFYVIALGVFELAMAFTGGMSVGKEILLIIGGILSIIFGIYLFINPALGTGLLIVLLGWYSLIYGIILVIYALTHRSEQIANY